MTATVIEVTGLRKEYRSSLRRPPIVALDGIDVPVLWRGPRELAPPDALGWIE